MECRNELDNSQCCDEVGGVTRVRGEDPQNFVSLRTGNNKVESNGDMSNGESLEREIIHTDHQSEIRAVETRSQVKQDVVPESHTTGVESRQDPSPSTNLPSKVILSSYADEDLANKQKEDPDISFVYERLLKGCKRPQVL